MIGKQEKELKLTQVTIQDSFWSYYRDLVKNVVIPWQEKILNDQIPNVEKSHAIENFRIAAKRSEGEFYGMVFQDSDLAKWLEAASYTLTGSGDPELEKRVDELAELIAAAQEEDGYLNTYFQLKEPDKKWENLLECHELYCAGHMIEAAVAHFESTGKKVLLSVAVKLADHIDRRFGKESGKERGIPGHEEIELALLRLFRVTNEKRYLKLAQYFIEERGKDPNFFEEEAAKRDWNHWPMKPEDREYCQNHMPVIRQESAVGHSVRAVYLYTAMADLAAETGNEELYQACVRLWRNIADKRMYVTGGIGSTVKGEAFTIDYDLPNDSAYTETCAAIGLIFFGRKMLQIHPKGEYADLCERALYNGVLSGMQHDGTRFFYVNPLEVVPEVSGKLFGFEHDLPSRPTWYACACCPPNVARLLSSLEKYAWGEKETTLFSHLFIGGTAKTDLGGGLIVQLRSNYPWEGELCYEILESKAKTEITLAVRIPGWCSKYSLMLNGSELQPETVKDGYLYLSKAWVKGDELKVSFELPVRRVYSNPRVRENIGCTALMRGPVVYCLEEADNGSELCALFLPKEAVITAEMQSGEEIGSYVGLSAKGQRLVKTESLYSDCSPEYEETEILAIPYFLWGNRTPGGMRVWIHEK